MAVLLISWHPKYATVTMLEHNNPTVNGRMLNIPEWIPPIIYSGCRDCFRHLGWYEMAVGNNTYIGGLLDLGRSDATPSLSGLIRFWGDTGSIHILSRVLGFGPRPKHPCRQTGKLTSDCPQTNATLTLWTLSISRGSNDDSPHQRPQRSRKIGSVSYQEESTHSVQRCLVEPFLAQTHAAHRWARNVQSSAEELHHREIVTWFYKEQIIYLQDYKLKHHV